MRSLIVVLLLYVLMIGATSLLRPAPSPRVLEDVGTVLGAALPAPGLAPLLTGVTVACAYQL